MTHVEQQNKNQVKTKLKKNHKCEQIQYISSKQQSERVDTKGKTQKQKKKPSTFTGSQRGTHKQTNKKKIISLDPRNGFSITLFVVTENHKRDRIFTVESCKRKLEKTKNEVGQKKKYR